MAGFLPGFSMSVNSSILLSSVCSFLLTDCLSVCVCVHICECDRKYTSHAIMHARGSERTAGGAGSLLPLRYQTLFLLRCPADRAHIWSLAIFKVKLTFSHWFCCCSFIFLFHLFSYKVSLCSPVWFNTCYCRWVWLQTLDPASFSQVLTLITSVCLTLGFSLLL